MKKSFNDKLELLRKNEELFLQFLKSRFPLFHNSNIFYRDFHFGVMKYFEKKEIDISYPEAEKLAKEYSKYFEEKDLFVRVNQTAWKLNYPEFVTKVPGDPL